MGWCASPLSPWRRGKEKRGGTLTQVGLRPTRGVRHPSSLIWPPQTPSGRAAAPPRVGTLHPLSPSPIYSGHFWPLEDTVFPLPRRSPALLPPPLCRRLAKPCRETSSLHQHHAVVLLVFFPNLFLLLAGSRCGRRHRAARVLNAEVPLFDTRSESRCDLNRREYDSINRVLATLPLSDLQIYKDALSPLSLLVSP